MKANKLQDLWKNVRVGLEDECWPWLGALGTSGYGKTRVSGYVSRSAHVLMYILTKGNIDEGKMILHACHNKACCNPKHLIQGTNSENQIHSSLTQRSVSSKSKIRGVSYNRKRNQYQVSVDQGKTFLYRGPNKQKAIEARLNWEEKVKLQLQNRNILQGTQNDISIRS